MRRLLAFSFMICLAITSTIPPTVTSAQESSLTYTSEVLGIIFQYPAAWAAHEHVATQTVTVSAADDWQLANSGGVPSGLIFSATLTTFRQLGIDSAAGFMEVLARLAANANPTPVTVGGMEGMSAEVENASSGITTRTVILPAGGNRVLVFRGLAQRAAWVSGGAALFERMLNSVILLPTEINAGLMRVGAPMWSLPTPDLRAMVDVLLSTEGDVLFVTDVKAGIVTFGTAGTRLVETTLEGIGGYGVIKRLANRRSYLADPVNGAIWLVPAEDERGKPRIYVGAKGDIFSSGSPRYFGIGTDGRILALDEGMDGARILVFNRSGAKIDTWNPAVTAGVTLRNAVFTSDKAGKHYLASSSSDGVLRFGINGGLEQAGIGAGLLADSLPTALMVDRFGNLLVATADRGILKFDPEGNLLGVIGESYDQTAPPKAGQLGQPVAMVMNADANTLYVADAGDYPQIAAFALDNNLERNLLAGTNAAGKIIYGETVNGSITESSFVQDYTFTGRRNDVVTITVQATDAAQLDMFVELLNTKLNRLAASDDAAPVGGAATDSQIVAFTLPANGEYTIRVTRFGRETTGQTGMFTLRLERIEK